MDLMSDHDDGGLTEWIVQPPSFCSQELTELCATLQLRLEAIPEYRAAHHRKMDRIQTERRQLPTAPRRQTDTSQCCRILGFS